MPEREGIISLKLNRKLSMPIAKFLAKFKFVTPNIVTIFVFFMTLLASLFFFFNFVFLAGLLVQLSSIIDGVDGDLANITRRKSKYGKYLDAVLDKYGDFFIILGLTYFAFVFENFSYAYYLGMFLILFLLMTPYTSYRSILSFNKEPYGKYIYYLASTDTRRFIIFIGSIFALFYSIAITVTLIILVLTHSVVPLKRVFYKNEKSSILKKKSSGDY